MGKMHETVLDFDFFEMWAKPLSKSSKMKMMHYFVGVFWSEMKTKGVVGFFIC